MGDAALNFFWFITGGFVISLLYFLASITFIATIFNYKTGIVLLKLAIFSAAPFGKKWKNLAKDDLAFQQSHILSYLSRIVLWAPFFVLICAVHFLLTLVLCVTVVGVPLARTHNILLRFSTFLFIESSQTREACLSCD